MRTYNQLLHSYSEEVERENLPASIVRQFLFELCSEREIDLFLELDNEVSVEFEENFERGMKRILAQEPLAYVLGYRWFYGYPFDVNADVLIPRDETAELVEYILETIDQEYKQEIIEIVDVGCGSGAIGLTLALEEKRVCASLSDISESALDVAKANAQKFNVEAEFYCGDMLKPLQESAKKWDILVSNPPYIPQEEVLDVSVKDFEPHVALFGGNDGLRFYRTLLANASSVLKEHGHIFFEIGWNQRENILSLAKQYYPHAQMGVKKDINGKDRIFWLKF